MNTILIADSSESLAKALSQALASRFDVHICYNGKTALTLLHELRPDILILQLSLPNIDGLSVLRRSLYMPPAVIALTNIVTDEVMNTARAAGIQDLVLIPCAVNHILDRIDHIQQNIPSIG